MANTAYYLKKAGNSVAATGDGAAVAVPNSKGIAEIDASDANLVLAVTDQRGARVDWEGTEEALTDGTKQTALTMSALVIRNGAATTVLTIKEEDDSGTIIFGPITIAANAERVIVFPEQIVTANGTDAIFVETPTGALHATPGFLIP